MSEYMFGVIREKLSARECQRRDRICREEGGYGYSQIDDSHGTAVDGRWLGWFSGPNQGEPFDSDWLAALWRVLTHKEKIMSNEDFDGTEDYENRARRDNAATAKIDTAWFAPRIAFLETGTDSDTVRMVLQVLEKFTVRLKLKGKPYRDVQIRDISTERDPYVDLHSHIMIAVATDEDGNPVGEDEEIELLDIEEIGVY